MNKAINIAVTAAIVLGISNIAYAKTNYNVTRFDGNDRYETSMKITNNFQSGTLQNIILASGNNFPDALAGSTLSKKYNAPILLINNNVDGLNYIKSHVAKNGNIYILGGTASIKNEYVNSIKNLGYNNIIRLGGVNRFDTNKAVIDSMKVKSGTPIVIANGYGFADALSISSVAADNGYPIFMTKADSLPDETKNLISNIKPSKVYIIGGQGSVKDTVLGQIKALVPSLNDSNIIRIDGQTRYETSLNICKYFNVNTDTAVLATGVNFPDALSGSALASKLNAPIILTDGHDISNQKTFIDGKGYKNIIILGGLGAIDLPTEYLLRDPSKTTQEQSPYKKYGYNIDNGLPKYEKALRNTSSKKVRIYCIGESITRGEYSSDEVNKSWVGVMKSSMQNKYGNAGEGFISIYEGALPSGTKPRWKLGNGWVVSGASNRVVSNVGGFGGCFGTSAKNISPASVVFAGTSVDLLYAKAPDGGTAVVTIDGKKVGTINCMSKIVSFSNKVSYSGLSNTTHKLVITPNTKSNIFIEGVIASSNKTGIEVDKIAISSKRASYFNADIAKKSWNAVPAPDLVLLCFGLNESAHGFSVQEYKANMIGLVNYWQSRGSNVCLVAGPKPADSWTTNWPAYVTATYEIANKYNVGIVDIYKAYSKDYTAAQKSGLFGIVPNDYSGRGGTNTAHPSDKGYKYMGDVIYSNLQ